MAVVLLCWSTLFVVGDATLKFQCSHSETLTAASSLGGNLSGSGSKLAPPETPQKLDLTRAVTSGNDCKVLGITVTSVQARRSIPDRK